MHRYHHLGNDQKTDQSDPGCDDCGIRREEPEYLTREDELEQGEYAGQHHDEKRSLDDGLVRSVFLLRAEVLTHDRAGAQLESDAEQNTEFHDANAQAVGRHHKRPESRDQSGHVPVRAAPHQPVQPRGHPYLHDLHHYGEPGMEPACERNGDVRPARRENHQAHDDRARRRNDRRERRARHAHVEPEDEHGIQRDVQRRRHQHDVHGLRRVAHATERRVDGVGGEHERETAEEDAPVFHGVAAHIGVVRHEPNDGRDSKEPDDGHEDRQGKLEQQSLAYDVPGRLVLALAVPSRDEGDRPRPDDLIGRAQDPGDRPEHCQRGDVTHP